MSGSAPRRRPRAGGGGTARLRRALGFLIAVVAVTVTLHVVFGGPVGLLRARNSMRAALRRVLRWYARVLHYYPLSSRAVSAGVIFFYADIVGQLLSGGPLDCARLARYTFYGLSVMGPFLSLWYSMMNVLGPEDDVRGALIKSVFEQVTLEPVCIAGYILYDGIILGKGWTATRHRIRTQFWALWVKNAIFWVPANFSNYYIGTPDLRVLFANLCSFFWNVYFSMKVNISLPSSPKSFTRARSQAPVSPKTLMPHWHTDAAPLLPVTGSSPRMSRLPRPVSSSSAPDICTPLGVSTELQPPSHGPPPAAL